MRRWCLIILLGVAGMMSAQESSVIVDLHGGVSKIMQGNGSWGPLGGIGLRYQYLAPVNKKLQLGVSSGLAMDYAQVQYGTPIDRAFSLWYPTPPSHWIDYTLWGNYTETFQQLRFQVPVLLAIRTHGVVINVGVGLSGWKMLSSKEAWDDRHFIAYYPAYEVPIYDQDPAGLLTENDFRSSIGMRDLEWSVNVIGEVGYEWKMRLQDGLGVQVFAQYGVWSTRVPVLDAGLKVYYRFGFKTTKRHRGTCHCL